MDQNRKGDAGAYRIGAKAHADVSSWDRDINFGLVLHQYPYFVHACSKESSEPAHLSLDNVIGTKI